METYLFLHVDFTETMKVVENVFKKTMAKNSFIEKTYGHVFFVQSLLVTSAIIIQMLNIFSLVCHVIQNLLRIEKIVPSLFVKLKSLCFVLAGNREQTKINGDFGHFRWHFVKRV